MDVPTLQTERLTLRALRASDAEAVFAIFNDDAVTRYYDLDSFTTLEQAANMIERMTQRNQDGDALRWGIALKENDRVIGTGGFNQFRRHWFSAGIGYDVATAYWNRGYMTEALRAIVCYGFENLNVNRIEALVVPGNDPSARVLEKLDFRREGLLRDYGFWKNRFWDLHLFALLKREWSKQYERG